MIIEILGRHIEIDDAIVYKLYDVKFKQYDYLNMNKEEFIQRGLDYFEHSIEKNIHYTLETNLGLAIGAFMRIAEANLVKVVSPFEKSFYDMNRSDGFMLKDDVLFLHKADLFKKSHSEINDGNSDNEMA